MKKNWKIIFIFVLLFIVSACSFNPDDVILSTPKEMQKYVNKNFGSAKLIEEQEISKYRVIYTYTDEQYGFNYSCEDAVAGNEFFVDGGAITYSEIKNCNFEETYHNYILNNIMIDENDISYKNINSYIKKFITMYANNEQMSNILDVIDQINRIDSRKYFKNYTISVVNRKKQNLGIYYIGNKKFVSEADRYVDQIKYEMNVVVNKNSSNSNGIKYLGYELVKYKDVERLNQKWITNMNSLLTEEDMTIKYYFSYKGIKYFILYDNVNIDNRDGSISGLKKGYLYGKYTSYWFE